MRLSLRKNVFWTLLGNVVYAGCQWGQLSLLARLGSPEVVGQFSLGLAVTAPIVMFGNLNLREVQATDAVGKYRFTDYLALRVAVGVLALLTISGVVLFAGYPANTAIVILAIGVSKIIESLSDIFYGLFQQRERMDLVARSLLIRGPVSLLAMAIGMVLGGKLIWGICSLIVAWTIVLFFHDITSGRRLSHHEVGTRTGLGQLLRNRRTVLMRLAATTFPLGLVAGLNSININIPRYVLEWNAGGYSLGIYSALTYVTVAGSTVVRAVGQSASPRLARMLISGQQRHFMVLVRKLVAVLVVVGTAGVGVAHIAGSEILAFLYGFEYAGFSRLFVLVMVAGGIGYLADFFGYALVAARCYTQQARLLAGVAIVTLISATILVPSHGTIGAALSRGIGSMVQTIGSLLVVASAVSRKTPERASKSS